MSWANRAWWIIGLWAAACIFFTGLFAHVKNKDKDK